MNILLIKHPTTHFKNTAPPVSGIPLGLGYLAACLRRAGHNVQIYDAIVEAHEQRWGFWETKTTLRMGATWDEVKSSICKINPDVVGISCQYTSQALNAIKTAQIIKEVNRNIKVIVGGPHATVMPSAFLNKDNFVDYVVVGEGELTIVELLEHIDGRRDIKTIKGLAYFKDGEIVFNEERGFVENIDSIPLPAYDLLDMERYFYFNQKGKDGREAYIYPGYERSVSMITSRGCPFNCIFCSIHLSMGHKFRAHSVGYVLEHIRFLKDKYRINHIHFEDDNLSFDIKRFKDILDGMISEKFNLTWDAPNGVRADYINEDILNKCKLSGCTYLRIGVESANEYVSKEIIKKHLDLAKVIEVAKLAKKIGIDMEAFYIIGFPGEKIYQMRETIDFSIRQELKYGLYPYSMFTATPLLGTQLYNIACNKGYISKSISPEGLATATQGSGMIKTDDFSPTDLKKLLRNFKIRHYFSRLTFFLKFLLFNCWYFFDLFKNKAFIRRQILNILEFRLADTIANIFLDRYKNCVIRKVGVK